MEAMINFTLPHAVKVEFLKECETANTFPADVLRRLVNQWLVEQARPIVHYRDGSRSGGHDLEDK